jgi:hypothetical protein
MVTRRNPSRRSLRRRAAGSERGRSVRALCHYGVAYQFKDKSVRRPLLLKVFWVWDRGQNNGLSQSTIRARVAHRWRSVDGVQSPETGSTTVGWRPERHRRTHRLWTAVIRLSPALRPESVFSSRSRFGLSTGGWVRISSRRARAHTARPRAYARRQPSRRICRASSRSRKPRR